jgi:hypothetical protein
MAVIPVIAGARPHCKDSGAGDVGAAAAIV